MVLKKHSAPNCTRERQVLSVLPAPLPCVQVAAYLLDHDHFARVPHTVMVTMTHPAFHTAAGTSAAGPPTKLGSLQEFVPHDCDTSEMGASRFSVRDVHRIGILDIRLMNTDRHAGAPQCFLLCLAGMKRS